MSNTITDDMKEIMYKDLTMPILYSKGVFDTESIIAGDLSKFKITNNSRNSIQDLFEASKLKLSNTTYKRMLFNYDIDTLISFITILADYQNEHKLSVDSMIETTNDNGDYIRITIRVYDIDDYSLIVQINNKAIQVYTDTDINGTYKVFTNLIIYDSSYKQKLIEINLSHDLSNDKYSEPYFMCSDSDSLLIKDMSEVEKLILEAYKIQQQNADLYTRCLYILFEIVKKLFSDREDKFYHTVQFTAENVSELIKDSVMHEKYPTEESVSIFPIAESNGGLLFCSVIEDSTTLLDGSYAITLYRIQGETLLSFNRYISALQERLQQTITRANCEDAFKSFIESTKAVQNNKYSQYAGRAFLEIYSKELEMWTSKFINVNDEESDQILYQEYIDNKPDAWMFGKRLD